MCMGSGESKLIVKLIIRVEAGAVVRVEVNGGQREVGLKQPWFRDEDEVGLVDITDTEEVRVDSTKAFAVPCETLKLFIYIGCWESSSIVRPN